MGINKTLVAFIGLDVVFLACGGLLITSAIAAQNLKTTTPTLQTVAEHLVFEEVPLTTTLVVGCLMVFAFLLSIPGMILSQNKIMLQLHTWMIVVCALVTLADGLLIWFETLQTTKNVTPIFQGQKPEVQSLLQQRFICCGFNDPTLFVTDSVCPNAADAARHGLCKGPFAGFSNAFLNLIFTVLFGVTAVDGLTILAALCVLKERSEQARYKMIDEKNGYRI